MNDNLNIEELFKETLSNAEVTPSDGVWNSIQGKMAVKATATAAKAVFSVYKALGIVALSAVVVTSTMLIINYDNNQNQQEIVSQKNISQEQVKQQEQTIIEQDSETQEVIVLNKENNHAAKEKIKVTIKQNDTKINPNESSVQTWLTPAYVKEKLMAQQQNNKKEDNKITTSANSNNTEEIYSNQTTNKNNNQSNNTSNPVIVTESISQEKIVASIVTNVSGGPSPLVVNFSNIENAVSYLWNFGDGKISSEANPTYIFEKAGSYNVTLQVKDKNGNSSVAKTKIEVKASSAIEIVNVFSPNGDGLNDFFEARTKENIEIFSIQLITTDAKKTVFTSNDVTFKWDGRDASGNPCPAGNYIFIGKAIGKDGKEYNLNGLLTLVR